MSKRQAERLSRLRKEKRGVVLLVVVSILTLFLMIGVTYVLVAGNYKSASGQALRAKTYGDESEREIEEVLGQVLYGTPNFPGTNVVVGNGVRSVIGPHSLLGDLYGNDIYFGWVSAINNYNATQTLSIQFTTTLPAQPIPNYFAGRVLTFTDGPAAGLSTRVMAYYPAGVNNGGTPELMVETPESDLPIPVGPSLNCRFIINGAPFNGTGAGFTKYTPGADMQWGNAGMDDDGDGVTDNRSEEGFAGSDDVLVNNLDETVMLNSGNRYPLAYLPNYSNLPAGSANPAFGGLDETWDAPDYQNPFLAMVPQQKMGQYDGVPLLPSFHRPDLVQYWMGTLANSLLSGASNPQQAFLYPYGLDGLPNTGDEDANMTPQQAQEVIALKRMMIFRPLREDHPNFTGGNQNFREDNLSGPYDIDNDGDGITDSIWIDAGLPPVTAPNGRRYKRLVAILIKDLDGRVHPSVHGNMQLATDANARPMTPITDTIAGTDPNNPQQIYVPRGLGFGPAEVDFQHLFNNVFPLPPAGDNTVYSNILQQRYVGPTGGTGLPGYPNYDDGYPQVFPLPTTNKNDRTLGIPDIHPITQQVVSNYATPPDVWGRAALAVDYTGQPLWYPLSMATTSERLDDPYELQWNQAQATWDSPYTVSELEALLRYHDQGASILPSRLMLYAGYGNPAGNYLATESRGTPGPSQRLRECFGMGSYIPAPRMIVPHELRQTTLPGVTSATILDLYYLAIVNGRGWQLNIGSNPADPQYGAFIDQMRAEVPFELLKGQMFNLNREFGNGQNDASNPALGNDPYGVVDDPSEIGAEQIQTTGGPAIFDYLNDSDNNPSITSNPPGASDPRQMMARHIYCLLMLLRNRAGIAGYDLDGDGMVSQAETARHLAQWAVNVVDFRDPDSIMTGFEYVIDPFGTNGWSVDGNLQTTGDIQAGISGVVWGVERPELLITETIVGHDRRTTDESDDQFNGMNNGKTTDAGGGEKDGANDFDQYLLPHGWAFIELYNPSYDRGLNGNANFFDHKPAELYTTSANGVAGVDLSRLTPNGNSPVWRMLIVRGLPNGQQHYLADPDSPQPESLTEQIGTNPAPPANYVDRTLYFADLSGGANYPSGPQYGEVYFPSSGIPRAPVLPGRYAVVGSSGAIQDAIPGVPYVTPIGRLNNGMAAGGLDPAAQDYPETRRIVLNPNVNPDNSSVQVIENLNGMNPDVDVTTILPAVALPVDSMIPVGGGVPVTHSFNISEPVGGYAPYYGPSTLTPAGVGTEGNMTPHPVDQPFDAQRNAATSPGDDFQTYGLGTNDMTMPNYRTIHLQRLANPLLAWNAQTNPYITVDTSSMDVTIYNGVATGDPSVTKRFQTFQGFQRGGRYYPGDPEAVGGYTPITGRLYRDLWSKEPAAVAIAPANADSPQEPAGPHYFTRALYHTLGYLNKRYHSSGPQPYFGAAAPGNYRGSPFWQDPSTGYLAPPFPWLAFNNRPFNNPYELLQVPCRSSSQFLDKFNVQNTGQPTLIDPAPPNQPWYSMYQPPNPRDPSFPYGHILNFFHTDYNSGNTASEVSRLFDFVETRTPFIQTEKYYNPVQFVSPNQAPSGFRPPFNYLSRFREPGRININTVFDESVWNAAVRGSPAMCTFQTNTNEGDSGQFLLRLALNRQGWGTGQGDLLNANNYNAIFPSFFSHPFRTADSADMMPATPVNLRHPPAEGGLLRSDPLLSSILPPYLNPPSPAPYPLNPTLDPNLSQPLFATETVTPSQDAARNPYFRFQPLQKVGNLFSTNSNCYAVWITVGYFEVEANTNTAGSPAVIDAAHPDGLRLAQEVGADEGNVKRHRAFFIIDRSIPVGYEPGHRHNTDKAVLLKRFIE